MVKLGCLARYFNKYEDEVEFAKRNGFEYMQLWYDNEGFQHKEVAEQVTILKGYAYPTIIHAVLDINEFEEHIPVLLEIAESLRHKELIIHPICQSEAIDSKTIFKLVEKVRYAVGAFSTKGITLFLENNSKLDPIFTNANEIEIMFKEVPGLEFLLDVAQIDNYEHLKQMIGIKMPKILHVADRHLEVIHEHLPIGKGNIDYNYIFRDVLRQFDGKIILEIVQSDEDIINSKLIIESMVMMCREL